MMPVEPEGAGGHDDPLGIKKVADLQVVDAKRPAIDPVNLAGRRWKRQLSQHVVHRHLGIKTDDEFHRAKPHSRADEDAPGVNAHPVPVATPPRRLGRRRFPRRGIRFGGRNWVAHKGRTLGAAILGRTKIHFHPEEKRSPDALHRSFLNSARAFHRCLA